MRANTNLTASNVKTWEDLRRFATQDVETLTRVINGRLGLTDNCQTSLLTFVFTAASSTVGSKHTIGIVPNGYILVGSTVDIGVFDGNRPNTSEDIYLQASGAGTARVLVF